MTHGPSETSSPWQPGTRLVAAVLLILFVALLTYRLRQLLAPLILATLLAYILHPLVTRISRWIRGPRWLGVLLVYLVLLLVLGAATTGLGLAISQQLIGLVADLKDVAERIPSWLETLSNQQLSLGPWSIDLSQVNFDPLVEQLASTLRPVLLGTGSFLGSLAASTASTVGVLLVMMVLAFYLLLDMEALQEGFLNLVPESYRGDIARLLGDTGRVWQAYLRGQLLLGLVIGVVVSIVLTALGVRFALGLGLLSGVLEFVPMFGPLIAGALGVLVALLQGGNWWGLTPLAFGGLVALAFVLIQQIENNVLVPRIIGLSLNLNPLVVLIAALAGASLAGVLGVLLAAPTAASLRLWLGYAYRKTVGIETWPASPVAPSRPTRVVTVSRRVLRRLSQKRAGRLAKKRAQDE
ncbi:MAG TPA: AI-2E family transporter [Anaerolineales bacterium]|nr:AI-2E family transporter [Anaerolineales bacterium]